MFILLTISGMYELSFAHITTANTSVKVYAIVNVIVCFFPFAFLVHVGVISSV